MPIAWGAGARSATNESKPTE
ncbi:hypothetical protein EVC37_13175 [Methylocaldum sp. BRCS4]|nr:hypothetical protein [Methylocaldum sp. BRCS4]